MAGERYPHIFLPGPPERKDYTRPPRKIEETSKYPVIPDRNAHSAYLQRRFNDIWDEFDKQKIDRQAVVHVERHGAYIEFASESGYELNVKSLEDFTSKTKARLRNVRFDSESQRVLATVYIPKKKRNKFLKKVSDYADPSKETKNGNPKHGLRDQRQ